VKLQRTFVTTRTWEPAMEETRNNFQLSGRHGHVVQTLGRQIVRGALAPGETVPTEDNLLSEFGVGRSSLREGVKVLAGKGLLESRTSAGTRVRSRESWNLLDPDVLRWRFSPNPSEADITVLANLRVALEPGAARLAAESADVGSRRMIEAAMAALWDTADDRDQFIEADLAFHRAIFVASDNDLLLYIHDVVAGAMESVRPLHSHSIAHNKETLPAHERVAVAIRKRHHRKAEEAMREVVEVARDDAIRARARRRR
jgi:GntR family galactonate operon transcriptional repressor